MRLCCLEAARALKAAKSLSVAEEVALLVMGAAAAAIVAVLGVWIIDPCLEY